jgi:hypothetical protein
MRWVDADALLGCSVDPSAEDAAAGEDKGVQVAAVAHGQFEVTVKRRGGYGLPYHLSILGSQGMDVSIYIVFAPSDFIGEQRQSLPKPVALGQLQPALCKAKVIGTQLFVLSSPGPTSALLGVLVTLADFFFEVMKQAFLPTLKMRCQYVGKRVLTSGALLLRAHAVRRSRRTHINFIYIL